MRHNIREKRSGEETSDVVIPVDDAVIGLPTFGFVLSEFSPEPVRGVFIFHDMGGRQFRATARR